MQLRKQIQLSGVLLFLLLSVVHAVPVNMDNQSTDFNDLINSNELSQFSRDLFGSVISAVRAGDHQKAALLIRRVLSAYPEHPVAWEFDGTLRIMAGDFKGAERSLIKSLTYMPERSSARAKMGLVRLAQNNFDSARKLFHETLIQDPDNWISHRYLARMADAEGNTLNAIEHYKSLVKSGVAEVTSIHTAYARDLARLQRYDEIVLLLEPLAKTKTDPDLALVLAESYMNLGQMDAARQTLDSVKKLIPDDPRIQLLSAIDLRISGQSQKSAQLLESLITKHGGKALFYYHYGLAQRQLGESEKARQAFNSAIDNSSDTSTLRVILAKQFEELKQPENVITALEPLTKVQTSNDVVYMLVRAYADSGKWQQGLDYTDRMIEKNPQFVPARLLRIEILRGMGQVEDAEDYVWQTLALFPDSVEVLKSYVRLLFQNHRKQQALTKFKKFVEDHPNNKIAGFMLANQYQAANYPVEAESVYRDLLLSTPDNPGLLNNLAIVLAQQPGKLYEALMLSKKAHQLAPVNAAMTDSLGWILHLSNQHKKAEEILEQALAKQPEMIEARCHLGLVKQQRGKQDKALLKACLKPGLENGLQEMARKALGN